MGNLVVLGIVGLVLLGIYAFIFRKPWDHRNDRPYKPLELNAYKNQVSVVLLIVFIIFAFSLIGEMFN